MSLTTRSPISMVPSVGVSSPAIRRSTVDLPQPDGPEQDEELLVLDLEADVAHRLNVAENLRDVPQRHLGHKARMAAGAAGL